MVSIRDSRHHKVRSTLIRLKHVAQQIALTLREACLACDERLERFRHQDTLHGVIHEAEVRRPELPLLNDAEQTYGVGVMPSKILPTHRAHGNSSIRSLAAADALSGRS